MKKHFAKALILLLLTLSMIMAACDINPETVTVTFDAMGGSPTPAVQTFNSGETATKPDDEPLKDDHVFGGWYTDNQTYNNKWNFNNPITQSMTLYAKWTEIDPSVSIDITFESNEGSSVKSQSLNIGDKITRPPNPVKAGFIFAGWFEDNETFEIEWDFNTQVTQEMTLYAKWDVDDTPVPSALEYYTPITTPEALYNAIAESKKYTGELKDISKRGEEPVYRYDGAYYLANDIDLSNYTWFQITKTFYGIFDGNDKTIKGLDIDTSEFGGLFYQVNGAVIKNLKIEDAYVASDKRAAALIANIGSNVAPTTVENISIYNSEVLAGANEGAGLITSLAKGAINISNVYAEGCKVNNNNADKTGGLVGSIENIKVAITDCYLKNVQVGVQYHKNSVGGLVGNVKNSGEIDINRVVMQDVTVSGNKHVSAVIGRFEGSSSPNSKIENVFFNGTAIMSNSAFGHISGDANIKTENVIKVFMVGATFNGNLDRQVVASANVIALSSINAAWWTTNINAIASSALWTLSGDIYVLAR